MPHFWKNPVPHKGLSGQKGDRLLFLLPGRAAVGRSLFSD